MIVVQQVGSFGRQSINYARDIFRSRGLILELARREFKARNLSSGLGLVWSFMHPGIMMLIYWLVFTFALPGVGKIAGAPFLVWILAGMVPWFIAADCIAGGASAVMDNRFLVKKVVFQVSLLPVIRLLSNLPVHLFLLVGHQHHFLVPRLSSHMVRSATALLPGRVAGVGPGLDLADVGTGPVSEGRRAGCPSDSAGRFLGDPAYLAHRGSLPKSQDTRLSEPHLLHRAGISRIAGLPCSVLAPPGHRRVLLGDYIRDAHYRRNRLFPAARTFRGRAVTQPITYAIPLWT